MSRRYSPPPVAGQAGRIGFYGCAAGGEGRIVRVAFSGAGTRPQAATVACPVCGEKHAVSLSWREPVDADEGREPDLVLGGEEAGAHG